MEYLKIPFDCKGIMEKDNRSTCSTSHSIKQYIHLMLTCYQGEFKFSSEFGNKIWEDEFLHVKRNTVTEKIKSSLDTNLKKFEKRLRVDEINVSHFFEPAKTALSTQFRHKVEVVVRGWNMIDQDQFLHKEQFYIAPLSA